MISLKNTKLEWRSIELNKDEFFAIANNLKAAYPREAFQEQYTFELWYECLRDLDAKWVSTAVIDLIKTMKFCPKISDIREKYGTYDRRTEQEKYEDERGLQ